MPTSSVPRGGVGRTPTALRVGLPLALALAGCGDERETTNTTETSSPVATSAEASSGSGGSTSTGGSGGSGGEGGAGTSAVCDACWSGVCAAEADACLADETCTCVLECDDDPACGAACGASAPIDALRICIVEASIDACVEPCDAACEACVFEACRPQLDACFEESACLCAAACEGDEDCEVACGAGAAFDDFATCVGGLDPNTCAAACP